MREEVSGRTLAFQANDAGSIPASRSNAVCRFAAGASSVAAGCLSRWYGFVDGPCGSVVEPSLGKGEVAGPIPAMGTTFRRIRFRVRREPFRVGMDFFRSSRNGKRKV